MVAADATSSTAKLVGLTMTFPAMSFIVFIGHDAAVSLVRDRVSRPAVLIRLKGSLASAFVLHGFKRALAER